MQKSCHVVDVIADQRYHANSFCAGNPTMKFYTESDPTEIDRVSSSHSLLLYLANTHTHTHQANPSLVSRNPQWETRRPEDLNSTRGIVHVPGQPQDDRRRSVRPSDRSCPRSLHASRLIKSRRGQSASMLCADPASRGPDFVSYSEGLYCNMETREVLPLCDAAAGRVTGCFDDGGNIVKRSEVERGDVLDELGYDRVDEWL